MAGDLAGYAACDSGQLRCRMPNNDTLTYFQSVVFDILIESPQTPHMNGLPPAASAGSGGILIEPPFDP